MLTVVTQDQKQTYNIDYFHLTHDEETGIYSIVGLARLNLTETELVTLGHYNYYRQAIEVFADMDYQCNDLMYYKTNKKIFEMPENIIDERELDILFPVHPF